MAAFRFRSFQVLVAIVATVVPLTALAEGDSPASAVEQVFTGAHAAQPVGDLRLQEMRGRNAVSPDTAAQQLGVILWDEQRRGVPPVRKATMDMRAVLQTNVVYSR